MLEINDPTTTTTAADACADVQQPLEAGSAARRQHEAAVAQLEAEARRDGRERVALEQQVRDLSLQVATLLGGQQRRKGGGGAASVAHTGHVISARAGGAPQHPGAARVETAAAGAAR